MSKIQTAASLTELTKLSLYFSADFMATPINHHSP